MNITIRKKGAIWNALGSTMFGINSFVMLTMVSRACTVAQTGAFSIAFTTAQMLYILGLFGISHYQMTDYKEKYSFHCYAKARVFSCILMLIVAASAVFLMGFRDEKLIYTLCLTLLMLINVIGELYQCLFFQKNRLDLSGSALFFRTLWSLTGFCIALLLSRNLLLAIFVQILCNILVTLYYSLCIAPSFIGVSGTPNTAGTALHELLLDCFPLFASHLLMNLLLNTSKYGIEFILDDTAQGYFNLIFMPVQVINLLGLFIYKPYLNTYSSKLYTRDFKGFFSLLIKQLLFVLVMTFVCCAGAYVLVVPVLSFIYNKSLVGLELHLTLIVFGGGLFAICQLFYYILVILRRQKTIMWIYVSCMFVSLAISYYFISKYSLMGAVIAFLFTHFILVFAYILSLRKSINNEANKG